MPDNHSICLLGFSPESENRIKKIIDASPDRPQITWVAANHKGLNGNSPAKYISEFAG